MKKILFNLFLSLLISVTVFNYLYYTWGKAYPKIYNYINLPADQFSQKYEYYYPLNSVVKTCGQTCKIHFVSFAPDPWSLRLETVLNYYVYPKLPLVYSNDEFLENNSQITKGDILISSRPLDVLKSPQHLEQIPEEDFYLYKAL